MNVLSLFDGMSCTQLALQAIGITPETYYSSEIDEKAMQVTQANFPDTIQLDSVEFWECWDLPKIDLMVAGFPCQDLSLAGKKKGLQGDRSGLFFKALNCLIKFRPKYFLFENVVMNKEQEKQITNILGVEPIVLNSADFTAQNRKRLFWTNIPQIAKIPTKAPNLQDILENGYTDRKKSYCIPASYGKGSNLKMYFEKKRGQIVFENKGFRLLSPIEVERLQGVPDNYTNYVAKTHRYHMLGNGFTIPVISHILKYLQEVSY